MSGKVGIIGSGVVAKTLAKGFMQHGYEVFMGTREPSKLNEWKSKANGNVLIGSVPDSILFGNIVVLASKGTAAEEIIRANATILSEKTIIDTTNPIADAPPQNGVLKYFTTQDESLMERLQKIAPSSNFVKAFNSVGNAYMVNPKFVEGKPTMFIAGNNDSAKLIVREILDLFGWETEDVGKAESARVVEPLCILWCLPGFLRNQWTHAFKLLKA